MSEVDKIIDERELTHGDYTNTARIIQKLKVVVMNELSQRNTRGQAPLDHVQRESIDMIVHKIGRIISGNPNTKDHWDDIAGYAQLASMRVTDPVAKVEQEVAAALKKEIEKDRPILSKIERAVGVLVAGEVDNNGKHF